MSDRTNGAGRGRRPTVTLVVPTRNEALHVVPFVDRVEAAIADLPIDWHAEVIDDSEDETPALLRGLAGKGAPLEVTRLAEADRKSGPGGAVRSGLARASGDVVCVIDADLQQPPKILPDLLVPVLLGRADICVGSRYRRGGSASGLKGRWRRLAARASGAFARWLLPATRLTADPGSGLFALRREVLESLTLRPRGSRVLAEILVRARWLTVCDVPYRFAQTAGGDPHLGTAATFELVRELFSLSRIDPRFGASGGRRARSRSADGFRHRHRVAPVNVELFREVEPSDPLHGVRSRELT